MSFSPSIINALEEAINRLAGELALARPGRDDGLIPAYSLLGELADLAESEPTLGQPILRTRAALDALLEQARPFDDQALEALSNLVDWLPSAMAAMQAGEKAGGFGDDRAARVGAQSQAVQSPERPGGDVVPADCLLDLNLDENRDLLEEFHAEALEHLNQIEMSLLVLDGESGNRDAIDQIFRSFHTIKGVAGFLQLNPLQALSHEVESLLDKARSGRSTLTPAMITLILHCRDAMLRMLAQIGAALQQGEQPKELVPVALLIERVRELAASFAGDDAGAPRGQDRPPVDRAELRAPAGAAGAGGEGGSSRTIRISTQKLDTMMEVVGELVIAHTQIAEASRAVAEEASPLAGVVARLGRITRELQNTAMGLRLVPVRPLFQKMGRLVRDLARQGEKPCAFQTFGEETEIDRVVVEDIADPLVHMIRNAVDHGLESPEVRAAAGKPASGTITLKAVQEGSHVRIELSDDGRGIDADRVHARAVQKGLVSAHAVLSHEEKLNLIITPGFSTTETVTALSGRGVGMDVVLRNITRLRGSLRIETAPGKGTTFRITLPLTLAIVDGLVFRVGGDRFILPSTSVRKVFRPRAGMISTSDGRGEMLEHKGRSLQVQRLSRKFQIPGAVEDPTQGVALLVETSDRVTALLVDEMVGRQEVVIKDLGGYLSRLPGISGGAILGDGDIALILDPVSLVAA
ncbi:MAG: chemotaxis protein CheA [Opitutaceae bacterium]|nr:chemotaxis protein CheA [Opitutaceae bacterium]